VDRANEALTSIIRNDAVDGAAVIVPQKIDGFIPALLPLVVGFLPVFVACGRSERSS
jgi:hypothetical protein